jgi:hypothetical protein
MMQPLSKAFDEAAKPPEPEQNVFANWMLAELASEQRWTKAFDASQAQLSQLTE